MAFLNKRLGIFSPNFARLLYVPTLDYKFLFNYIYLWRYYALLSATTQRPFRPMWTFWAYDGGRA